jgi:hypothetical protein
VQIRIFLLTREQLLEGDVFFFSSSACLLRHIDLNM